MHHSCARKIIGFYDPVEDEILSYEEVLANLNMNKQNFKSDGYADTIEDIFLFKPISKIIWKIIQI